MFYWKSSHVLRAGRSNQLFRRCAAAAVCTVRICNVSNVINMNMVWQTNVYCRYSPYGCSAKALRLLISVLSIWLHTMLHSLEKLTAIDLLYLIPFSFSFFSFFLFVWGSTHSLWCDSTRDKPQASVIVDIAFDFCMISKMKPLLNPSADCGHCQENNNHQQST